MTGAEDTSMLSVAEWDDLLAVNLRHHFFATQAVVPMMRAAGRGSVINLGSMSAQPGALARGRGQPLLHGAEVGRRRRVDVTKGPLAVPVA
jgi:NAD(P)-dependent dehydrogenase (short-subunit alcohol dehydrogenase family)